MSEDASNLRAGLRRRLLWIAVFGLVAAAIAVLVLALTGPITFSLAAAVVLGVFFTILLGGGLFAVSFFSDSSGYDSEAADFRSAEQGGRIRPDPPPPATEAPRPRIPPG